jgi:hypothetical protein
MIATPQPGDILCGKDKTYGKHPGNCLYRNLIQTKALDYATAPTKQEKMRLTKQIVAELMNVHGSRFLKCVTSPRTSSTEENSSQPSENGSGASGGGGTVVGWVELSAAQARDKTSHALRFCVQNTLGMDAVVSSRSVSPTSALLLKRAFEANSSAIAESPTANGTSDQMIMPRDHVSYKKRRTTVDGTEAIRTMVRPATNALDLLALAVESHCQNGPLSQQRKGVIVPPPSLPAPQPITTTSTPCNSGGSSSCSTTGIPGGNTMVLFDLGGVVYKTKNESESLGVLQQVPQPRSENSIPV